jgi:hypothetical protein
MICGLLGRVGGGIIHHPVSRICAHLCDPWILLGDGRNPEIRDRELSDLSKLPNPDFLFVSLCALGVFVVHPGWAGGLPNSEWTRVDLEDSRISSTF